MNFNRYRCQQFIESEVGCNDPANLNSFKEAIKSYSLPPDKVDFLKQAASSDSIDVFFKSALSFFEALYSLKVGHSSWAIIKLYYSIFYSLRCFLLLNNYAPIKNGKGDIYFLECVDNSPAIKISTNSVKGDHKTTIKAFSHFFPGHRLNTNSISGESVFEWAMQCRELVNYRNASFIEPEYGYSAMPGLMEGELKVNSLFVQYVENEFYSFCFDKEHSMLSTAIVLLRENVLKFRERNIPFLSLQRHIVIERLIKKTRLKNSIFLTSLFLASEDIINLNEADEADEAD